MGAKTKKIGGNGQTGTDFSQDWIKQIQQLLGGGGQSGFLGAGNPAGATGAQAGTDGAVDLIHSILGQGAGNIGGALAQILQSQQDRDVAKLKEAGRASGGANFGTPGAYAESMYRANAAPQITSAIGQLQLNAAKDIFGLGSDIYNKNTAQADTIVQPGIFDQILKGVGAVSGAAQQFFTPGLASKSLGSDVAANGAVTERNPNFVGLS